MADLTGQIFGTMEVISLNEPESEERSIRYGHKRYVWNCKCIICGYEKTKMDSELKNLLRTGTNGCKQCQKVDLTGLKIGRLKVLRLADKQEVGKQMWLCQCDCGNTCEYQTGDLRKKNPVQSCGCLHSDQLAERNRTTAKWLGDTMNHERLHQVWSAMKHRCESEKDTHYHLYGGRGIAICEEWHDWFIFRDWALSHGYQDDLTIDRINVNGNYEPDNCRWVTQQVQANNMRTNKILTYHGEDDTLANWCRRLNLDYFRTKARLNTCGYSVEDAFERGKYEYRTT